MCKSNIFLKALELVAEETEISEVQILSNSKVIPVVDARSILVEVLTEQGLYPRQIAVYLHKTPAAIRNMINNFYTRTKNNKIIAIYTQNVRKSLESQY